MSRNEKEVSFLPKVEQEKQEVRLPYQRFWCEENVYYQLEEEFNPPDAVAAFAVILARPGVVIGDVSTHFGLADKDGELTGWDFHVVAVYQMKDGAWTVRDLDAKIPDLQTVHEWIAAQWPTEIRTILDQHFLYPCFRIMPASTYRDEKIGLRSDRSHMMDGEGKLVDYAQLPPWPPIFKEEDTNNLRAFIDMTNAQVPGKVLTFGQFEEHYGGSS